MRPFTAIAVLVGLSAFARGDEGPPATTISALARARGEFPAAPVRVQGTVTFFDPPRRCLCLQDGTAGLFVHIPLETRPLRLGERVEVRGRPLAPTYLDAADVRIVGDDPLPDAVAVTGEQFVAGAVANRRVQVRGVIRAAGMDGDRAVLILMAGRSPIRVYVREPGSAPLPPLVDAEVRVVGVCGPTVTEGRGLDGMKLLVQSLDGVTVERPAPERPFELPRTALADVPDWSAHRVRIGGEAVGPVVDGVLTLRENGRTVGVAAGPGVVARTGERFEAVGFPAGRDGAVFLDDATVRGFALRRGVVPAQAGPDDFLPILRTAGEVRRLPLDEANRGYPVRLIGTVTYHEPAEDDLFVHDGTTAVFVSVPHGGPRLPAGTVVRIDGYSDPGRFAPVVAAERVTTIRPGLLPPARRVGFEELVGGQGDGQWVEVDAVVRGTRRGEDGELLLLLRFGSTVCPARVAGADTADLRRLFGATVRVRANCGSQFNTKRQWQGLVFYVPSIEAIEIRRPPPAAFGGLPLRTVESLSQFDPGRGPGEPVRLSGVVVARRGTTAIVQDATGGIAVELQPDQPGAVGDRVEVRGFLVRRGPAWAVEDGLARSDGPADPLIPRDVTATTVAAGGYDATLIRIDAILVDQFPAGDADHVFLLRSAEPEGVAHRFYPAILPRAQMTPELYELRPGTRLRVTAACMVPHERLMVSSFRIIPRTAADIEIVDQPSWWTPRKALFVAAGVASFAVLSLAWVVTLRRRVRWQTEQIRRRLEHEAHLEARYRELFETANDAVFTLDAAGTVKAMNRSGRELTGLDEGGSFLAAVAPDSLADARALLESRAPVTREVRLTGPGGEVVLEVSARPLLDGGSSLGVQAIARDLTDRKRLEVELRQAQKMEAIGRLAGGVAHDFNNLLTVINGNGDVLRAKLPPADAGLADEIVRAGEQAAALTRQLLAFSRKGVVAPRVLRPNDTIAGVQKMLARLVGERVRLVTDLDEAAGCVRIDPGQLEQALLNLAVNARDAMPQGGTLAIRTQSQPAHVRIEVTDTGVGMDARTRARVFEPFFTTKPAGEGTGLGLATVKGIVEQAGGTVAVASEPGRGAAFTIDLPLAADVPSHSQSPARPAPPPANKEVILLVEDEPAVQLLERRVLEMGRYEVLVASTGEEALNLLDGHAGPIDLLVTDVVMPGMTGRELAEAVASRRPGLRALFLSGYTPDEVLRQGVRAEEAHFLQKPFTPSSLLGKVRDVLARV